jgi:hypothetical protein
VEMVRFSARDLVERADAEVNRHSSGSSLMWSGAAEKQRMADESLQLS